MVKGKCKTNLDDYQRCEWPNTFSEGIRVGDSIREVGGEKVLRIVRITHTQLFNERGMLHEWERVPYLIIELNK